MPTEEIRYLGFISKTRSSRTSSSGKKGTGLKTYAEALRRKIQITRSPIGLGKTEALGSGNPRGLWVGAKHPQVDIWTISETKPQCFKFVQLVDSSNDPSLDNTPDQTNSQRSNSDQAKIS